MADFLELLYPRLLQLARRLDIPPALGIGAEDLAAEAALYYHSRHAAGLMPENPGDAYLARKLRNQLIDLIRSKGASPPPSPTPVEQVGASGYGLSPEQAEALEAEINADFDALREALAGPRDSRTAASIRRRCDELRRAQWEQIPMLEILDPMWDAPPPKEAQTCPPPEAWGPLLAASVSDHDPARNTPPPPSCALLGWFDRRDEPGVLREDRPMEAWLSFMGQLERRIGLMRDRVYKRHRRIRRDLLEILDRVAAEQGWSAERRERLRHALKTTKRRSKDTGSANS